MLTWPGRLICAFVVACLACSGLGLGATAALVVMVAVAIASWLAQRS